jgi:hypothetical protein
MRKVLTLATLLTMLVAWPAAAQETTGSIEGVVRDPAGAVLTGATVELAGPAGRLVTVTDERGEYRFPRLRSGRYTVTATLSGFATQSAEVDLTVGINNRTEFTLALSGIAEAVTVSAKSISIDTTSSSTATNISRERIELIPRGRDFTDVVAQAAGAKNESQAGGISIDGSSGSENRFIIDGIDTTSPQVGTSAVPLRAEFLEEVQVKSAGYAAQFGGSTGGVINVITKSGTNNYQGGVVATFENRSWGGGERALLRDSLTDNDAFVYINPPKDKENRIDPGFYLGGPIVRDRLWFFGSYQPGIRSTKRTVNFSNGDVGTFPQDFRVNYGTWNITYNQGTNLVVRGGGNYSPYETKKTLPGQDGRTSLTSPDDYLRGTKGQRDTYSGSVDYIPTSNFVISARLGRFRTDSQSTGVDFFPLIHNFSTASTPDGIAALPPEFRQQPGYLSDILVTNAQARDEYIRNYIGADATWYVEAGGRHEVKFGYQTEKIFNDVQRGYNADRILYYAGRTYRTSTGEVASGQYGYFRLLNISTLGDVASRNDALFIQDSWHVNSRITLNIGVRSEHERVPNFGDRGVKNPIEFGWGQKFAPRLGFAYDPTGDATWKIYGSWGKYFDVMKYEMPRGSFGGDKWVDYFYTWDNPNFNLNASGCATGSNTISERPTCAAGTFIEPLDRRFNSAEDLDAAVEPDLKPMEENEFQMGFSHELSPRVVIGARYIYKNLVRTIEDVGIVVPGIGEVYYIANPGEGITLTLNDPGIPGFPKAEREYQGLEFTFERRYSSDWALYMSYTYSRLYGNYSGLASSDENGRTSPNVNRFFDHIENSFDRNGQLVYGRLGTDRPHVFKGQFIYGFDWDMNLSFNQIIGSGLPVSEQAFVGASIPFFPYGRGNLGRTPVVSQTDMKLSQTLRFGGQFAVELAVNILNLFDQDTVTRRDNNRTFGSVPVDTDEFFAGGWDYEGLVAANPNIQDVKYNQPNQYLEPRVIRFDLKFRF